MRCYYCYSHSGIPTTNATTTTTTTAPNTRQAATTTTIDYTLLLDVMWLPTRGCGAMLTNSHTTEGCGLDVGVNMASYYQCSRYRGVGEVEPPPQLFVQPLHKFVQLPQFPLNC